MKDISTYFLLIIISISSVNTEDCGYNFVRAKYQGSCIKDCKQYERYEDAEIDCNNLDDCVGIGFVPDNSNDFLMYIYTPPYYYLTGKGRYLFSSGFTLIKNCNNYSQLKFNNYIQYVGKDIPGCLHECKKYKTLEEAQAACFDEYECTGVTFTRVIQKFDYSDIDDWGFQLRTGKSVNPTMYGESSWLKIKLEY